MAPMTVGAVTCGVTLIIENTQSLAVDQVLKFNNANSHHGPIDAFQLDTTIFKTTVAFCLEELFREPECRNFYSGQFQKISS